MCGCVCVCIIYFVISVIVCFQSLKSEEFHIGLLDCMAFSIVGYPFWQRIKKIRHH